MPVRRSTFGHESADMNRTTNPYRVLYVLLQESDTAVDDVIGLFCRPGAMRVAIENVDSNFWAGCGDESFCSPRIRRSRAAQRHCHSRSTWHFCVCSSRRSVDGSASCRPGLYRSRCYHARIFASGNTRSSGATTDSVDKRDSRGITLQSASERTLRHEPRSPRITALRGTWSPSRGGRGGTVRVARLRACRNDS
jgi:hypothetical protein